MQTIQALREKVSSFEEKCAQLEKTASSGRPHMPLNKGKLVTEGCPKTDRRKIRAAGSSVVEALENVLESYGLNICQLLVADIKGLIHNITVGENGQIHVKRNIKRGFSGGCEPKYDALTSSDQRCVRNVAALLDNHYVSNVFWEQLSAELPNLPTLWIINSYRQKLDKLVRIFRTPGQSAGAQVSFEEELQSAVQECASCKGLTLEDIAKEPLLVKVEGDGCVVNRHKTWTMLSFVIIQSGRNLQSHRLHRLLAIAEIPETYFSIRESFGRLIRDINAVASRGSVRVGDHEIPVRICIGSDMKFLLLVQGLMSASSKFPCPFCRADPKKRVESGARSTEFSTPPLLRTAKNMREDCLNEANGMKNVPLFNVDPVFVIPDVMHMGIRIMYRLIDGLLVDVEDHDNRAKVRNPKAPSSTLKSIINEINNCGLKFEVWQDERKGMTFTSLTGGEIKRLLKLLPDKLPGHLPVRTEAKTVLLWKLFGEVLEQLEHNVDGRSIQNKASEFFETFLELGKECKGYGPERVTPYMHILAHHASSKHETLKCLGWFSSQGIEKKNDVLKHLHHSKTNKWNAAQDALKLAKRLEAADYVRISRAYRKLDAKYWSEGLIQEMRTKRRRCANEDSETEVPLSIENMDGAELRTELRVLGVCISTKSVVQLREKLINLKHKRGKPTDSANAVL
ncbi:hypothetical protein HPB50_016532 [Hyalomma asiaticum]|uniref:Uncharacterized protein n=1 Tax=Hyalomma asiaticum TaxID=266040 RepID=A0ACB7SKB7_HYAAI|nr:hypothetical protein HPB50_016532 [Hyalomma asiaticum]